MKFLRHFRDVMRFNQLATDARAIVFYCEGKNYWPHLEPIVSSLLKSSDVVINFVSSDEHDPGLKIEHKNCNSFVIGDGFIRNFFFEKLSCQLMVMTMPDLDQFQIKKSPKVNKYVYVHHSLVSHHMVYRPKAFDAFDVIMCGGPHHNNELNLMAELTDMPPKQLIDHGYGRLDSIMANHKNRPTNQVKKVLVAPSWGEQGTLEVMGEFLLDELMKLPYEVILRPHPQTLKNAAKTVDAILKKYSHHERFVFESGVASEASLHDSDLMISDWSGAAMDYAFGLLKPVLFIDVPKKIQNPGFKDIPAEPFESAIRTQIGQVQSVDLDGMGLQISTLLNEASDWRAKLINLREQHVYHLGESGNIAAQKLLELL